MIFYEFFAGGGMARLGRGGRWKCKFSNDNSPKKAGAYRANFPNSPLLLKSIYDVAIEDLPSGAADLAWASFPCQDLSLAGNGAGLGGKRSGTFWTFSEIVTDLKRQDRAPRTIVLENVTGAITSNKGRDFAAILAVLAEMGYTFGPLIVDGVHFVPQSRPRLFIIAADVRFGFPDAQCSPSATQLWHSDALCAAYESLPEKLKSRWMWLNVPEPPERLINLSSVLEPDAQVDWNSREQTDFLLSLMSDLNLRKVRQAQAFGRRLVGALYKRTRKGVQRAEVRFDEVAGCLRTPGGGSSRQTILVVDNATVRSRLITPREAARLMGVPDSYKLPKNYNEAYHLMGDGLVVPAVSWLERWLLSPICEHQRQTLAAAWRVLRGNVHVRPVTRPLCPEPLRGSHLLFH
ncbi:MAG: DNA cytosine methyltransferase [Acidobacteriota bacterium]|nr:DNA cytosine methyltransferase [Acidobacteriota bacterium]